MAEKPEVLIVGAGFAGMYAIHRFRSLGLSVRAFEAGTDVGGTWYWNRYPGARCDVPSLEYSYGFSEELQQEWSWPEVFSAQPDILEYANHVAERFDLRRDITFNTVVTEISWQEVNHQWRLTTDQGDTFEAPFCVMATGCLSVPNKPDLPGADTFKGRVLHTGLWPKEVVDLTGLRVGVIGTGSSGVQAIPELARLSGHLTVFQRTPVYSIPANRKQMREAVENEFKDNYRQVRELQRNNFRGVSNFRPMRGVAQNRNPAGPRVEGPMIKKMTPEEQHRQIEERGLESIVSFGDIYSDLEANEMANELFRDTIRSIVRRPAVAEKLLPKDYGLGCKRQVLDRDYYETFNREDVELVDLRETPIETITDQGIQTNERHYELDVLIYATGFDAMTGALLKSNISGRDGLKLAEKWQYGPVAYLGLQMRGFPNLFTVTGPGSPSVLCNMMVAIEQHVNWIGDCIDYLRKTGTREIEPLEASEERWIGHVNEVVEGTMFTVPSCKSWYLGANIEGKPRIFMPYIGGFPRYRLQCEQEAASGYEGFALG